MKSKKSLALLALLALSSASLATAATTVTRTIVHVTGSTAYRSAVLTAEVNSLKAGGTVNAAYEASGFAASLTSASNSIVYGPVVSNAQTVFENAFNGSIGGLFDLQNKTTITYMSDTYFDPAGTNTAKATPVTPAATDSGSSPNPGTANGTGTAGAYADGYYVGNSFPSGSTNPVAADMTMSDVFLDTAQAVVSSVSSKSVGNPTPYSTTVGGSTVYAVGVVPFVFVVSNGTSSNLTNITAQQFGQLYAGGTLPLSFFDGLNADEHNIIYALGRDCDSGTRATAFAETGFGAASGPTQYYPYDSTTDANNDGSTGVIGNGNGAGTTINGVNYVPDQTLSNGLTEYSPTSGYASGGNLAVAMRSPNNTTAHFLTYLGLSDCGSALTGSTPARTIGYNGSSISLTAGTVYTDGSVAGGGTFADGATSAAKFEEGQYTFWGYEHLFYNPGSLTTTQVNVIKALGNDLSGGDDRVSAGGANGVTLAAMEVSRTDDGQSVSATYSY